MICKATALALLACIAGCGAGPEVTPSRAHPEAELAWSVPGEWLGVASDPISGEIWAFTNPGTRGGPWEGSMHRFDARGQRLSSTALKVATRKTPDFFALAELDGKSPPEFLFSSYWGRELQAFDAAGRLLWTYILDEGFDSAGAADLDGDGRDEVYVGLNGPGGLLALDASGNLRWRGETSNAWSISFAPPFAPGSPSVIVPSRDRIRGFDPRGELVMDIEQPVNASVVLVPQGTQHATTLVVFDSGSNTILCSDLKGRVYWETRDHSLGRTRSDIQAAGTLLAISGTSGVVAVYETRTGDRVTSVKGQRGYYQRVAWTWSDAGPLFVVANFESLRAYKVPILTYFVD